MRVPVNPWHFLPCASSVSSFLSHYDYRLLLVVQTKNMASNLTTSERFSRKKNSESGSSEMNANGLEKQGSHMIPPSSSEEIHS